MEGLSKPVVLIVEDEALIRMVAVDAFLNQGFKVLEAEHATEALAICSENTDIQLLFTDVNMPGDLNGIDLAERLSATAPKLRLIIASALPILRPIDHLSATFFRKPYDTREVTRTAKALLAA